MFPVLIAMFGVIMAAALAIGALKRTASSLIGKLSTIAVLALALCGMAQTFISGAAGGAALTYPIAPQIGVYLSFGAGMVGIILILLVAIVCVGAEFSMGALGEGKKGPHLLLMLFEAASIGLFMSTNLLVFFMFGLHKAMAQDVRIEAEKFESHRQLLGRGYS